MVIPIWILNTGKKERSRNKSKKIDDVCFQYAIMVALSGIQLIQKLDVQRNSKINSNCEKLLILVMISIKDKEVWYYLAIKKLHY